MDWINIVLPILGTFAGGLCVQAINWYKEKRGGDTADKVTDNTLNIAVHDQALKIYQDVIAGLRSDLEKLEAANDLIEQVYMDTREENAILRTLVHNLPCQKIPPTCDKGFAVIVAPK